MDKQISSSTLKKETLAQVFSYEFCQIFEEHLLKAASVATFLFSVNSWRILIDRNFCFIFSRITLDAFVL